MYVFHNSYIKKMLSDSEWGTFIQPDQSLENHPNPAEKYNIVPPSGGKANFYPFIKRNALFDSILAQVLTQQTTMNYEDQCSSKYYFDMFTVLEQQQRDVNRIVEVGVYLGGASCILAGMLIPLGKTLDLVDVSKPYLRFTYERIRRLYPEAISRVRMFFGDLPSYVKNVMQQENGVRYMVQHDGSHNFNEVVKDLAALSFVKDRVNGLMIQDTHLRSANIDLYTFVDAAIYTIFGYNMKYTEIGIKNNHQTVPAYQYKTYFLDNHPEGMYIPFALNQFRYPHPTMELDSLLLKRDEEAQVV